MAGFPSLSISADTVRPHGAFAEAQAVYLQPDQAALRRLEAALTQQRLGVIAHFYMDPELQGLLAQLRWPHVFVADSLAMADAGLRMAQAGVAGLVVLGVDFMAENARAVLDANGFAALPVYRVSAEAIGCSLAEAADSAAYGSYLEQAARVPHSLHVVYINTSLQAKALAQRTLPTIACTSSNVLRMMLQAYAQVPGLRLWFGPDTFMGQNLATLLRSWVELDENELTEASIRAVHPAHDRRSIAEALSRFDFFRQGRCIVHQTFDQSVVERLQREAADAFVTAHLEVPGEMFALALAAQRQGRGVVGSTSQILAFIQRTVELHARGDEPLRFVLGTESGMITAIVRQVQATLAAAGNLSRQVEIILPVADQAVQRSDDPALPLLPGVASGEGCSASGGCATCPYMKMNSLRALFGLIDLLQKQNTQPFETDDALQAYWPPMSRGGANDAQSTIVLGTQPITAMRDFQRSGELPPGLVQRIRRS